MVALVFLVLITLLAIGASSGSLLQQRMVAATRNAQLAEMSANTALRGAEWRLWTYAQSGGGGPLCYPGSINPTTGCIVYEPGLADYYGPDGKVTKFRTGNNDWLSIPGSITYKSASGAGYTKFVGADAATANVAENPQYIIEDMGIVKPPGAGPQHESGVTGTTVIGGGTGGVHIHIYRITARATGGSKNTVRVVQSTFDAQSN